MPIIAVFNQKGGVGKTTTTLNVACALLRRLVQDEAHWNAFGFIGAEADLTRANGPCAAAK